MAVLKTQPNPKNVNSFLESIENEQKKEDSFALLNLIQEVTNFPSKMWGESIIGFGTYHYQYASGREGDWFLTGFSPRKQNIAIYIMAGFDHYEGLMKKLGKYKNGKSCLYIKKLSDIDVDVLQELITNSIEHMQQQYGKE